MQSETVLDNPQVQNEMKPGEHLLWWGKPNLARRVKNHNTSLYINTIFMGILAVFMLFLVYNAWNLFMEEIDFSGSFQSTTLFLVILPSFMFILCLFRIALVYYQFQKARTNLVNTTYAITDQRIIVITATGKGFAVKSHTRGDIGQIVRMETGEGWGDVSYGIPRSQQSGSRSVTVVDKLVGVPNAWMVEDVLMRTFKSGPPAAPQQVWYPPQPQPQYYAQPTQYPPQPQYYAQPTPPQSYPSQQQYYTRPQETLQPLPAQPYPPQPTREAPPAPEITQPPQEKQEL
jgi:hypothetical protein